MAELSAREKGLLAAVLGMAQAVSETDTNPDKRAVRRDLRRLAAKLGVAAEVEIVVSVYRSLWECRLGKP